jgi:hypothetical protein
MAAQFSGRCSAFLSSASLNFRIRCGQHIMSVIDGHAVRYAFAM